MARWQDFLSTPEDKEYYIRHVLDIDAGKGSKEYRNAYRYLDLIQKGERPGTQSTRYARVVADTKRLAELVNKEPPVSPPPKPPSPSGRVPVRVYVPGITMVRISNDTTYRTNFGIDIADNPESLSYEYAAGGDYDAAMVAALEESIGDFFVEIVHENPARPIY